MEIFKVGGAVRDHLMGVQSKDIDYVVVGSTPEAMVAAGYKQVGADFPVFLDKDGTEYALARTERKSGRGYLGFTTDHSPDVTLVEDLKRRDLTINAMAATMTPPFHVVDPFGGQEDLTNKVLRHVSEAFRDDPVRVLRLGRFWARYGHSWRVADETVALCQQMVADGELDFLTGERVYKEMEKALSEPHAELFFEFMRKCGAMRTVFPELDDAFLHYTKLLRRYSAANAEVKFAIVMYYIPKTAAAGLYERLRVPSEQRVVSELFQFGFLRGPTRSEMVDAMYSKDLFRKKAIWKRLVAECVGKLNMTSFRAIDTAFDIADAIRFKDVKTEGLSGPQISEAIKQAQKAAVEKGP